MATNANADGPCPGRPRRRLHHRFHRDPLTPDTGSAWRGRCCRCLARSGLTCRLAPDLYPQRRRHVADRSCIVAGRPRTLDACGTRRRYRDGRVWLAPVARLDRHRHVESPRGHDCLAALIGVLHLRVQRVRPGVEAILAPAGIHYRKHRVLRARNRGDRADAFHRVDGMEYTDTEIENRIEIVVFAFRYISTASATPFPPPRHREAIPL